MTATDRELARIRTAVGEDTFATRFDVGDEVGRGGMGVVYRAVERATGRAVAIKVLPDDVRDHARFFAESAILERMAHPAIVGYVGHGVTSAGLPYLAMEWLDGESVAQRLATGPLSVAATIAIGARVAAALAHAHTQQILHRDIKPSNVLLVAGDPARAMLIDFGVAKDQVATTLTQAGQLVGTPHYMAPEQVVGTQPLDGRADLFGLGCLLHECLTGVAPFSGNELIEVLAQVLMREPPPLSTHRADVPPRLAALVDALLAKKPDDRIADAALVATELTTIEVALANNDRAVLDEVPAHLVDRAVTLPSRPTKPLPQRPRPFSRWIIAGAGATVFLAGVTALILLYGSGPQPDEQEHGRGTQCRRTAGPECVARCVAGDGTWCIRLAELWGQYDREALPFVDRACALGKTVGCFRAGLARHRSSPLDPVTFPRASWVTPWQRGCDLGDDETCTMLASTLLKVAPPDPVRARAALQVACDRGHLPACKRLAQMPPP